MHASQLLLDVMQMYNPQQSIVMHQQNKKQQSEAWGRYVKIIISSLFVYLLCDVRNEILYA